MSNYDIPNLSDICQSAAEHLGQFDVGSLNMVCASGLPGAETLEIGPMLDWLDSAARQVDFETRRHWYRFRDSPATYLNSPGYFCCYFLLQVLQEDFGVRYNPARVRDAKFQDPRYIDPDFRDSRDLFIHGIIDGPGGTCASMPVLYVAVGRRLGYPLKLAETRAHLFFRWEDPEGSQFGFPERFNVEGAGEGIAMYPDEHYRVWPEPWSVADECGGWYLKSLSPAEELASFLVTRGECLADNGRIAEAIDAYRWACRLAPNDARYAVHLRMHSHRFAESRLWAIETANAINRRNQQRLQELLAQPATNKQPLKLLHGPSCQCHHCCETRQSNPANPVTGFPSHSDSCHCYHCREARSAAARIGFPGNHPNCNCLICRERKKEATSGHKTTPNRSNRVFVVSESEMYMPELGRFLSRDPLAQNGEGELLYDFEHVAERDRLIVQMYAYASNNPIVRVDPTGLADTLPCRRRGKKHIECTSTTTNKSPDETCPPGSELVTDTIGTVDVFGRSGV